MTQYVGTNYGEAWTLGSPVFRRLPEKGYRDNTVTQWIVTPVDEILTGVKTKLEGFYASLNPATCPDDYLDYVGFLMGYSDTYWDTLWSNEVKRQLCVEASSLWHRMGTHDTLQRVLTIHAIIHGIWVDGVLLMPFLMPGTMGTPKARVYVRLPLIYMRTGKKWLEAMRTVRNYTPAPINSKVVYDQFYLGFSVLGEPMFVQPL